MPIVAQEYIEIDERGVAKIIGSRAKVRQIVMDTQNGLTPERIHEEYPHLSLAQIHAALAYYYDHQAEIDADIEAGIKMVEEMRAANPNRLTRAELDRRWREKFGTEPPGATPTGE